MILKFLPVLDITKDIKTDRMFQAILLILTLYSKSELLMIKRLSRLTVQLLVHQNGGSKEYKSYTVLYIAVLWRYICKWGKLVTQVRVLLSKTNPEKQIASHLP